MGRNRPTYLANPALEILITCGHDVATMLLASLNQAVICVCTAVTTWNTLKPRVFRQSQRQSVFLAQLFQLRHDAISDTRNALRQQTIHHRLVNLQLVLDREVDKVGIYENMVRRSQLSVVLEEHCCRSLVDMVLCLALVLFNLAAFLRLCFLVFCATMQRMSTEISTIP